MKKKKFKAEFKAVKKVDDKRDWYRNIYLKSDHWKIVKHIKLCSTPECEECGSKKNLDVHHLCYRDVYNVRFQDLKTLCRPCHTKEHEKPKEDTAEAIRAPYPKEINVKFGKKLCEAKKLLLIAGRAASFAIDSGLPEDLHYALFKKIVRSNQKIETTREEFNKMLALNIN